jgi:hypothetical protein
MNPVELLRFVQFLQIIARAIEKESYELTFASFPLEISRMTRLLHLGSMTQERVKSILKEIETCGLCSAEKTKIVIDSCNVSEWQSFTGCINYDVQNGEQRWSQLDGFLSEKHDLYKRFSETSNKLLQNSSLGLRETLAKNFSKPTVSTLIEWACKLNRVQQNYLNGEVYPVQQEFKLHRQNAEIFKKNLGDFYVEEKRRLGYETVSLPVLAEKVCSFLRIRRRDFCTFLKDLYVEYPSGMWLGTGVIRTYAYEGFLANEQSILDVLGNGPWFLREFYYKRIDLPEYVIDNIPRKFIKIEKELLGGC